MKILKATDTFCLGPKASRLYNLRFLLELARGHVHRVVNYRPGSLRDNPVCTREVAV